MEIKIRFPPFPLPLRTLSLMRDRFFFLPFFFPPPWYLDLQRLEHSVFIPLFFFLKLFSPPSWPRGQFGQADSLPLLFVNSVSFLVFLSFFCELPLRFFFISHVDLVIFPPSSFSLSSPRVGEEKDGIAPSSPFFPTTSPLLSMQISCCPPPLSPSLLQGIRTKSGFPFFLKDSFPFWGNPFLPSLPHLFFFLPVKERRRDLSSFLLLFFLP